jgi:hypothetical protein
MHNELWPSLAEIPHLIYKSIRDAIKSHEGRNLFCLPSAILGEETPRTVFVTSELHEIVNGPPWPNTWEGRRYAALRGLLDGFTEGDTITIALDPFDKDPSAMMARVHPVEDEVWDFRSIEAKSALRVFGRFSEPDTFIGLTWNYREILDWNEEVHGCKEEWNKTVPSYPPVRWKGAQ